VEKLVSGHRLSVCCSSLRLSQALFSRLLLFVIHLPPDSSIKMITLEHFCVGHPHTKPGL